MPYSCRTSALCRCSRGICVTPFWWGFFYFSCRSKQTNRSARDPVVHFYSRRSLWRVDNNMPPAIFPLCLSISILLFTAKQAFIYEYYLIVRLSMYSSVYVLFFFSSYNSAVILSFVPNCVIFCARYKPQILIVYFLLLLLFLFSYSLLRLLCSVCVVVVFFFSFPFV